MAKINRVTGDRLDEINLGLQKAAHHTIKGAFGGLSASGEATVFVTLEDGSVVTVSEEVEGVLAGIRDKLKKGKQV